MHVKTINI